jgi:Fur family ferric uptake transcriptional regulator
MREQRKALERITGYAAEKHLKMTQQRELILKTFLEMDRHVSPEELFEMVRKKDRRIGHATVYRMLKLMYDSGIARTVDFRDGVKRFEYGYTAEHHDHLICEKCGKSVEVIDDRIEQLQESLAKSQGFKLKSHEMYLYGICAKCSEVK